MAIPLTVLKETAQKTILLSMCVKKTGQKTKVKQNKTKKAIANQTEKPKSKPHLHPLIHRDIVYNSKIQNPSMYSPAGEHAEKMQTWAQWTQCVKHSTEHENPSSYLKDPHKARCSFYVKMEGRDKRIPGNLPFAGHTQ